MKILSVNPDRTVQMKKLICKIFLLLFILPVVCYGQDTDTGPGYQLMLINNPAFSGSDGEGSVRMSYFNFYPGNGYNLHSLYLTYDSYFSGIHGGTSFYITDDYLGGIINDIRGGFSYAYYLQAGRELYINAGLSASVFHRGYSFGNAVLPDQIDPLGGVSATSADNLGYTGRTALDIGAGFLFMYRNYSASISLDHLAQPDLTGKGLPWEKLSRKIMTHVSGDFSMGKLQKMKISPVILFSLQGRSVSGAAGVSLETMHFTVNLTGLEDYGKNLNLQAGFSLLAGGITIYYNYRFNVIRGNVMMPLSLLHQTGLAFSLNKVEKRNNIKTINFPKM
jgi:type IX secretion system PorP/SprF family membrane protein